MEEVTGRYMKLDKNGCILDVENHTIKTEVGAKVLFVDNSYLNDCYLNRKWVSPAGTSLDGYNNKTATVLRCNSVQSAYPRSMDYGTKREVDMPIVVQLECGEILYCNPLNIRPLESIL